MAKQQDAQPHSNKDDSDDDDISFIDPLVIPTKDSDVPTIQNPRKLKRAAAASVMETSKMKAYTLKSVPPVAEPLIDFVNSEKSKRFGLPSFKSVVDMFKCLTSTAEE